LSRGHVSVPYGEDVLIVQAAAWIRRSLIYGFIGRRLWESQRKYGIGFTESRFAQDFQLSKANRGCKSQGVAWSGLGNSRTIPADRSGETKKASHLQRGIAELLITGLLKAYRLEVLPVSA
jgi:hypothetical protein